MPDRCLQLTRALISTSLASGEPSIEIDRRVVDRDAAFGNHRFEVAVADRVPAVPSHSSKHDLPAEVASLESERSGACGALLERGSARESQSRTRERVRIGQEMTNAASSYGVMRRRAFSRRTPSSRPRASFAPTSSRRSCSLSRRLASQTLASVSTPLSTSTSPRRACRMDRAPARGLAPWRRWCRRTAESGVRPVPCWPTRTGPCPSRTREQLRGKTLEQGDRGIGQRRLEFRHLCGERRDPAPVSSMRQLGDRGRRHCQRRRFSISGAKRCTQR